MEPHQTRARSRRATVAMAAILLAGCVPLTWSSDEVGQAWIGRPLDQLKEQWKAPVEAPGADGGYEVTIEYGKDAYTDTRFWETQQPNGVGQLVTEAHSEDYVVPAVHFCTATFFANAQRIITSYQFVGAQCREYVTSWGPPIK